MTSILLPCCFDVAGYKRCGVLNEKVISISEHINVMPPQRDGSKPFHLFAIINSALYIYFICNDHPKTLSKDEDTNAIEHIKIHQYTHLPMDWWTEQKIEIECVKWENSQKKSKTSIVQMSQNSMFSVVQKPICEQAEA